MVRNVGKAALLSKEYPKVRIVNGDLDSAEVIEEEVKNADIVFRISPPPPNYLLV